jgi:anti-sigma B factor antagonist
MRDAPLQYEILPGQASETLIVRLNGPLTLLNLFGFQDRLREIEASHTILDFENVPYMDSAGLGAVMNLYVSSQKKGRKVSLTAVNARVLAIFQQTKVDSVLTFFPSVEAAEARD